MKKPAILCILTFISFAALANGNSIEGKWQPYDISITIEGVPSAISTAIAQQVKSDPSTECVRNSIIEVKKDKTYTVTNACEENQGISGTWTLNGDKLSFTLSVQSDTSETITIKSITEELITIDITDRIPSDFEFNGIKPTSLLLILKKM